MSTLHGYHIGDILTAQIVVLFATTLGHDQTVQKTGKLT